MSPTLTAAIVSACLFAAVFLGMYCRRLLPEHHLSADTKDTVKLAMGLVATMAALLLGLLVSSAKGSYDAEKGQVVQMAAKIAFLDRVLASFGPEAADARSKLRSAVEIAIGSIWPDQRKGRTAVAPNPHGAEAIFAAIQALAPQTDAQRVLKAQAVSLTIELGQLRDLLTAQSLASVSKPMLIVVVGWLVVIFLSFSLFAPPNATANVALLVSTLSVAGAIFLLLELDQPFNGLIQVSSEPMLNTLHRIGQ